MKTGKLSPNRKDKKVLPFGSEEEKRNDDEKKEENELPFEEGSLNLSTDQNLEEKE
jgi:hypothetical protein